MEAIKPCVETSDLGSARSRKLTSSAINNTSSRSRTLKSKTYILNLPILLFKISRDSKIHAFPCNKEIYLYKTSYSTVLEHV